jgi:hypothetical protein
MKDFPYAVWLVPCAEQRIGLKQIIQRLAARFGTPLFEPHSTLCSGIWTQGLPALTHAVDGLAGRSAPLSMAVTGLDWIDRWFGFFFLRLRSVDSDDLFIRARRQVAGSHPPEIGPHVSLLYNFGEDEMDRAALRDELAGTWPAVIRFDALKLVRPASGSWEDISSWEILHVAVLSA